MALAAEIGEAVEVVVKMEVEIEVVIKSDVTVRVDASRLTY